MNSNEFYNKFNKNIENMNSEQIKDIIKNVIRKIPETKYEEILNIFDKEKCIINEKEIIEKIEKYKEKFNQINDFELYFHATGYEEYGEYYSPWGEDWVWEYTDEENLGSLIKEVTIFAIDLINKKQYKYAKKLIDIILYTNYQCLDDDGGDNFELSLHELEKEQLININVNTLCLYAIYVTYQCSNEYNRIKNIYEYFKNENFKNISIEDSFKLGSEVLNETNRFWKKWIDFLLTKPGNIEYRLLKEAFEYNNYDNYKEYVDNILENHPKIYIDIFEILIKDNKINEIIEIGNKALSKLDKNLIIRNDIALYLAKYDSKNKEKYIIESFKSKTNVPNLLRIINNGYFNKYENEIKQIISVANENAIFKISELKKNIITSEDYNYLKFFAGNFEDFYVECSKVKSSLGWSESFIQYGVYLWLLYFNKNLFSKVYNSILSQTFNKFGFEENTLFLDNQYSMIFETWKSQFEISNNDKYIDWLKKIIDRRVDAIVSNGYRNSYFKAAILVVALGEILESNNIQSKNEFIDIYHKKYSRKSSFRKELDKYVGKIKND